MPPAADFALVLALMAGDPTVPPAATPATAAVADPEPGGDLAAWGAAFREAVNAAWTPPLSCRVGHAAAVALRVEYLRDGGVPPVSTLRLRGAPTLEEAARQALEPVVRTHEPPPIPDGDDSVGITYSFFCNMTENAQKRWSRSVEKRRAAAEDAQTLELGSPP